MRLYINESTFISVIKQDNNYSCQIMELIHGMGMYKASIVDNQIDVVSSIVDENEIYSKTNLKLNTLEEIFNYHELCITEYYWYKNSLNK